MALNNDWMKIYGKTLIFQWRLLSSILFSQIGYKALSRLCKLSPEIMMCGPRSPQIWSNICDMLQWQPDHRNLWPSLVIHWWQGSWVQHGAHLGPTGPRWAPCWPQEFCYLGSCLLVCLKCCSPGSNLPDIAFTFRRVRMGGAYLGIAECWMILLVLYVA